MGKPKESKNSVLSDLKSKTMLGIDQTDRSLGDFFLDKDFHLSTDKKQIFIKHDALLRVAKQIFGGIKKKRTTPEGLPKRVDNFCSVVTITYLFGNGYEASATADCSTGTAQRGFKNYTTALAETRASSRALRYALGIEIVAAEEISDIDDIVDQDINNPALDQQKELLKRKFLRDVDKGGRGKSLKDIALILGRKIRTVDEMTKGDAMEVLEAWNSEKVE